MPNLAYQESLPGLSAVQDSVNQLAEAGIEERGAIYTRREVVEFILDLVGYTVKSPLISYRLLEPSFGEGDFLLAAADRLLSAWRSTSPDGGTKALNNCIRGVELHRKNFNTTRSNLKALMKGHGLSVKEADTLLRTWLIQGDFLLTPLAFEFSHVVGNPPYVRQELIPQALIAEYRQRFQTIFDRADLYIPFIENSLSHLEEGGALGFICADRWMKNRYGGPLRKMVSERFHLKYYVDMVNTPAFLTEVSAYPAITVITKEKTGPTRLAHRPKITRASLSKLARTMKRKTLLDAKEVKEMSGVMNGIEPWILESFDQLAVVRRLESQFPAIEDIGCKVGIGVATGADKVFIGPFDTLNVEPDRKLPLAMTKDIIEGTAQWRGYGVINPFKDDGSLVDLLKYPKLAAYFEKNKFLIKKRHVSKKNPNRWYRTIDRIYPELAQKPKLLIPDIKGEAHIVYEDGHLYPHHNLYFITSDEWDLRALQAVLKSGIARLFISIYSTKMRGGFLRYQAQYLRRIRIPRWEDVPPRIKTALMTAAEKGDASACNSAVFKLYGLSKEEREAVRGNGEE